MENLTYSQCKLIINFCEDKWIDFREVIDEITSENKDFEVGNFRFILESEIDKIQVEELESDPYILGCFIDWFIADNTNLDYDIVKALQEAEKFEAIGNHIIDNDNTKDMQAQYSSMDGYGHHFARYDLETHEDLLELGYYAFQVN